MDKELRAELTELQSEWLGHVRAWEQSGVSLKSYAEHAGVDHRRLYRFKRILTDKGVYREGESVARRFVRAEVQCGSEPLSSCRVRFCNGCVVEFGGELRGMALRELLQAVSTLP